MDSRWQVNALGVRGIHTWIVGVASVALSFGLLPGCGPGSDCSGGEFQCDGDVAMNCQPFEGGSGTYYRWQSATCRAGLCKSESGLAFCVASADPNPKCKNLRQVVCDGNTIRQCVDGYASDPGTVCALCREYDADPSAEVYLAGAQCIQETSRNPNCPSTPVGSGISGACDGNDVLQCEAGLVVSRQPCGTGF